MTLVEHLRELRTRLIVSLAVFVAFSAVAFFFYDPLLRFLNRPLCSLPPELLERFPQGCRLIFVQVLGGFMFRLKLTALAGLALSLPVWLYQTYAFIVPALTAKEKRYSVPMLISSVVLFAVGATLAYLTLPTGVRFLISIGGSELVPFLGAEEYLSFVGLVLLGFGLMFELPLLLLFLGLAEVLTVDSLRSQRRAAVVIIFALSAVVTPSQDPYTMTILAVALYGLYELTIFVLALLLRRRARRQGEAQP